MTSVDEHGPPTPATPPLRHPRAPHPPHRNAPPGAVACGEPPAGRAAPPPNAGAPRVGRSAAAAGPRPRPARVRSRRPPPVTGGPPPAGGGPPRPAARLGSGARAGGLARPATRARRPRLPGRTRPPRTARCPTTGPRRPFPGPTDGVPRTKRAVVDERSRAAAQRPPVQRPPVRLPRADPGGAAARRGRCGTHARRFPTLGPALLTTLPSTRASPVPGHLALRRVPDRRGDHRGVRARPPHAAGARRCARTGPTCSARCSRRARWSAARSACSSPRWPGWPSSSGRTCWPGRRACGPGSACSATGSSPLLCLAVAAPLGLRRRARQLPAPAARTAVPVAGRRHPRRGGHRQGAAERPAGRQRRRAGPARHADRHDDGRERGHAHRPHDPVRAPPQPAARAVPAGIADGPEVPPGLPQPLGPALRRLPAQRRLRLRPQLSRRSRPPGRPPTPG